MEHRAIGITATSLLGLAIVGSVAHFMNSSRRASEAQFVHDFFRYASISGEPAPYMVDELRVNLEGRSNEHAYDAFLPTQSVVSYFARPAHWNTNPLYLSDRALTSADGARKRSVALMGNLGYRPEDFEVGTVREMNSRDLRGVADFGLPDGAIVYSVMVSTIREEGQRSGTARRNIQMIWEAHRGELVMWLGSPRSVFGPWEVNLSNAQAEKRARAALAGKLVPSQVRSGLAWVHDGDFVNENVPDTKPKVAGYRFTFFEPDWTGSRCILIVVRAADGKILMILDQSAPIPDYPTDS